MSQTDPIADFLTGVRNGCRAGHKKVIMPSTNIRKEIARVLQENKYIRSTREIPGEPQSSILIRLRYTPTQESCITGIRRISRPGLRRYMGREELRRTLREMGILILSTSRGVMSDRDAAREGIGGEVLCRVW